MATVSGIEVARHGLSPPTGSGGPWVRDSVRVIALDTTAWPPP